MKPLRAAIIGAGRPRRAAGATGFGMAHFHAAGYEEAPDCQLAAVADIRRENAEAFGREHSNAKPYEDYLEMLRQEEPDVVSICVWDPLHCRIALDCIAAGVKAIHCEKPMAPTYGEARRMAEAAEKAGALLSFNHQMRYSKTIRQAKLLAEQGAIGELRRVEAACGNLFDEGTHWFDLMLWFNGQTPVEWLIGQIDSRTERSVFGVRHEDQAIAQFHFKNGVEALMATGAGARVLGHGMMLRLCGTEGVLEIAWGMPPDKESLRIRKNGPFDWEEIPREEALSGPDMLLKGTSRAVQDAIAALRNGSRSLADSRNALQATELIFATYESCRRRARIDFPLDVDDSPFLTMLADGSVGTGRRR